MRSTKNIWPKNEKFWNIFWYYWFLCLSLYAHQILSKSVKIWLCNNPFLKNASSWDFNFCKFLSPKGHIWIAQWHRLQRPHSVKIRASGPISAGPSLGPQQNHNKISANKSYDPIALWGIMFFLLSFFLPYLHLRLTVTYLALVSCKSTSSWVSLPIQ